MKAPSQDELEKRLAAFQDAIEGRPAWDFIVMQEASQRAIQRKFFPDQELKPFLRTFRRSVGASASRCCCWTGVSWSSRARSSACGRR
jgi:hypothetical protein